MKATNLSPLPLLAMLLLPAVAAQAETSEFALDGGEGTTLFTKTVDGATLTVQSPSGGPITALPNFIVTGNNYDGFMKGFDFTFDTDVDLIGYTVGSINLPTGAYFDLVEGTSDSRLGNSLETSGYVAFETPLHISANQVVTLTSTFPNPNGYAELLSLSAVVTVPEPDTYALLLGVAGGVVALYYRRARAKQA